MRGGAGGSPPLFGQNLWTKFSPFHQCLFDFMLCSTFPVSHCSVARTEMFPAAYANTFCFQRKLFVSFPTFCREKKMLKWCCRSGTANRGTRCWRPTSPAPYSSLSASTFSRWSLFQSEFGNKNVHPTKPGVYYLKRVSLTSSYFDRIIPLYPPDDRFSRVSLATRINQTWSMRPSKE